MNESPGQALRASANYDLAYTYATAPKSSSQYETYSRPGPIRDDAQATREPKAKKKTSFEPASLTEDFQEEPRPQDPQFEYQKVEQERQLSHLYYTQNVGVLMQPMAK